MGPAGLIEEPLVRDGGFHRQFRIVVVGDAQLMGVAHREHRESGIDVDDVAQGIELPALEDGLDAGPGLGQRRLIGDRIVSGRRDGCLVAVQARRT